MRHSALFLTCFCSAVAATWAQAPVVQVIPPAPMPGLLGPRTVIPVTVACTDLPTSTMVDPPLRILTPHAGDRHDLAVNGHVVVLNGGTPQGFAIGQRYFTRRLTLPVNREPLTDLHRGAIRTSGWLTVIAADERSALARIDYACTAIEAGDYLEPFAETQLPSSVAADGATDFSNLGRVLSGVDRREQFGAGELLSIDRGSAHGVTAGTRVAFYRDRENGAPLVEIGGGIVLDVAPNTAKVVLDRTHQEVRKGDYFGMRRTP